MVEKVFLFDFDGVIADSLETSISAFEQCIEKYHLESLSRQKISSLFKNNIYDSALKIGIPYETLPLIFKDMKSFLCENSDKISLFSGMKEVLEEISEKSDIYVISSTVREMILDVLNKGSNDPYSESADHNEESPHSNALKYAAEGFGNRDHSEFAQLGRQSKDSIHETGEHGHRVKATDGDSGHDFCHHRSYLNAEQRAQEHAHSQRVKNEPVYCILRDCRIAGCKDDLKDVGSDRRQRRYAENVNENGERQKPASNAHDTCGKPHQSAGEYEKHPRYFATAGSEIMVKADHRGDIY